MEEEEEQQRSLVSLSLPATAAIDPASILSQQYCIYHQCITWSLSIQPKKEHTHGRAAKAT